MRTSTLNRFAGNGAGSDSGIPATAVSAAPVDTLPAEPAAPAAPLENVKGPASLWWESHPASMPSSTVLWTEDEIPPADVGAANEPY
jgi:hypothetical protein